MTEQYLSLKDYYEKCLRAHGDNHLGVNWPNAADAETRYGVMLGVIREHSESVTLLDLGCGTAHLLEFLLKQGLGKRIEYSGLDVSSEFVAVARTKFPSVRFLCQDILAGGDPLPQFDYIVMNGVFTVKDRLPQAEMESFMQRMLTKVFPLAKKGLAFNVMSKAVDWEREDLFHVSFDSLAAFLRGSLSRHFVFRQDYGLYEYSAYVYREGQA